MSQQRAGDLKGGCMVINKKQREAFHKAAKPMIKFLNDNCHPHCHVTIDCGRAELSEGVAIVLSKTEIWR